MENNGITDNRKVYIPDKYQSLIWTPDTFIQNSKETIEHTVTQPNRGLYVYGNGTVLFSVR